MADEKTKKATKTAKATTKAPKGGKGKPDKKDVKKTVKKKEDGVVEVKHSKAYSTVEGDKNFRPIDPRTGTRCKPNTSQQTAFEIVLGGAQAGRTFKEIKAECAAYRKENGKPRNLDAGYAPWIVASHPENFRVVRKDGVEMVEVLVVPKPDPVAIKALEEKEAKKKAAKEQRKSGGKAKPDKPAKGEKPAKKAKPTKPTK